MTCPYHGLGRLCRNCHPLRCTAVVYTAERGKKRRCRNLSTGVNTQLGAEIKRCHLHGGPPGASVAVAEAIKRWHADVPAKVKASEAIFDRSVPDTAYVDISLEA